MTIKEIPSMRTLNVAEAKAHLSAVLSQVEAGEEIVITRRGQAVARIVPETAGAVCDAGLTEWFAFVDAQPLHTGPDAGELLGTMRQQARF